MFEEIKKSIREAAEKVKDISGKQKDAHTKMGVTKDKTGKEDDPTIQGMVVDENSETKQNKSGDSNQFEEIKDDKE